MDPRLRERTTKVNETTPADWLLTSEGEWHWGSADTTAALIRVTRKWRKWFENDNDLNIHNMPPTPLDFVPGTEGSGIVWLVGGGQTFSDRENIEFTSISHLAFWMQLKNDDPALFCSCWSPIINYFTQQEYLEIDHNVSNPGEIEFREDLSGYTKEELKALKIFYIKSQFADGYRKAHLFRITFNVAEDLISGNKVTEDGIKNEFQDFLKNVTTYFVIGAVGVGGFYVLKELRK